MSLDHSKLVVYQRALELLDLLDQINETCLPVALISRIN